MEQLSYHDRYVQARGEGRRLPVMVPAAGRPAWLAERSAVVVSGEPDDGTVVVHYEGWVHGAMQYEGLDARGRWEAGVLHAAGRAVSGYPTAAMAAVRRDELVQVGWFDLADETVEVTDEAAVARWLA